MRQERVYGLLTILGAVVLIALALELYVRIVADSGMDFDLEMWKYARDMKRVAENPLVGHVHVPNVTMRLMGVEVSTNSRGLRDYEYPYERTPGKTRILMLGDSVTFGWGVPLEETTAKRLERLLNQSGTDAEVINAGVGNYNTIMEVQSFLTEGRKYQPDIVVLNYFINDAEPVPTYGVNILARISYAYVYFSGRLDVLLRQVSRRRNWEDYYLQLYDDSSTGWIAASEQIGMLAEYCNQNSIKLLIVNYPELRDLQHYRFEKVNQRVRQAAGTDHVFFLDLLDDLQGVEESRLWVTRPDPHPNSYANKLFADSIFRELKKIF